MLTTQHKFDIASHDPKVKATTHVVAVNDPSRFSIDDAEKLDRKGRRMKSETQLERPIKKLIFLFRPS